MQTKTDNALLSVKLDLRRYFLKKYHAESMFSVLDCCQGSGYIWKTLRSEYPCSYIGYDVKEKKGRLKIDSKRVPECAGLTYDVVDIDTYGEPWGHYSRLLENTKLPVTVFMTHGIVMTGGGNASNTALKSIGLLGLRNKCPNSLLAKAANNSISYCLAECYAYGIKIIEAVEAFPQRNARYYGLRLERNVS